MESVFKVYITPRQMREVFEDVDNYNVRSYTFCGIEKARDFDAEACSDAEWDALRDTPCLYRICLRHDEWLTYLIGTYKSWMHVRKAIRRRELALERYVYSQFRQTRELFWRAEHVRGYQNLYYIVKVMQASNGQWYACKGSVDLSVERGLSYGEIIDAIEPYGYKCIKDVRLDHGEDAYGYIAECAFERMPEDGMWRLSNFYDSKEEIIAYVEADMLKRWW